SSVNIDMVKNIINDSIDQNNGTMATFGPTNTTNTSLTLKTSGLRTGNYILLTGVYNSEDKLVAFDQSEISINKAVVVYNGGGGGGGGGGSSGEAYENIALKNAVRLYLSVNNPVEYTFTDDANPIRNVKFTPLANKGYTSVVIEVLRNTSGLVSTPAPGLVYQNMNIWVGLAGWANEQTVSNAEIHFRVDKNWLKQNNVGYGDIVLVKHHGEKWTELPTTKTSDDSGYVYYSVKTSEFSPFAIIAKTTGGEKITPVYENDEKDDPAEIEYNESVTMTGDGEEDDSSGIPGFGAMISVGLIGAAYYMRKIRE
ncbi:MAG TPA: PGF-pre-PGF domain-containing protein, partial [Methanosarcinaceae archaeon]|nr:PGF-pre-PGF domain-containing protein [Methanosarcinaceae archaeon]